MPHGPYISRTGFDVPEDGNPDLIQAAVSADNPLPTYPLSDFYDDVSLGLHADVSKWNKFGYNPDIDNNGEMVIWPSTATFTPLLTASTFTIAYDGTAGGSTDGTGTTGATEITFSYIDSTGAEATAVHTLGTDGSDVTSFSGFGINRAVVSASGSNDTNGSDITITATTGGTTQAIIKGGEGITQQLIFFVASNRYANAKWFWININKLVGGATPNVTVKAYVYNRNIQTKFEVYRVNIDTAVDNIVSVNDPVGFTLDPSDIIYFVADSDTNNTEVTGRFTLTTKTI